MHPRRAESGSERRQHVSSEDRPSSRARSAFPRPRTTGRGRPGSQPSRDKPCGSCRSTCCLRRVRAARGVCGGALEFGGKRDPSSFPPGWLGHVDDLNPEVDDLGLMIETPNPGIQPRTFGVRCRDTKWRICWHPKAPKLAPPRCLFKPLFPSPGTTQSARWPRGA